MNNFKKNIFISVSMDYWHSLRILPLDKITYLFRNVGGSFVALSLMGTA